MNIEDVDLLRPEEVAEIFRVSPKTVTNWARRGLIQNVVLPGRQRRYPANEVYKLLEVEQVVKYVTCEECEGDGQCTECTGSGEINNENCGSCDGSGTCQECAGNGEVEDNEIDEYEFDI